MFKIEKIVQYLERYEEARPIAKKYAVNRHFLVQLYPNLANLGTDETIMKMIKDACDIDRKIRRAKQLHPHLKGDEDSEELEEKAKEDLGYTVKQ